MNEQTKSMLAKATDAVLEFAEAQNLDCMVVDEKTVAVPGKLSDLLVLFSEHPTNWNAYKAECDEINKLAEDGKVYTFEPGVKPINDGEDVIPEFIVMDRDADLSNPRVVGAAIDIGDALKQAQQTLQLGRIMDQEKSLSL